MSNRILARYFPSLPLGWDEMPIGDALDEVDRPITMRDSTVYDLVSIRRRNGGMFHRESILGSEILTKTLREVVPGTFVIARMQVVHGATALAPAEFAACAISKSYSSFQGTARCDANYFSWLAKLPFMYAYFLDSSHGVVIEKMTFDQQRWMSLPVYLPPPREQSQITEVLDTVDVALEATARLIAKLEQVKQGLLHDLLTRGIDVDGHLRDPVARPDLFVETDAGSVPVDWRVMQIGEFAQVRRGASPRPIDDPRWFAEDGPGWVRIQDVTTSTKYLRTTTQRLSPAGAARSVPVKRGDVIMSIAATVGETIIVAIDARIHDGFVVVDQDRAQVTSEYLALALAFLKRVFVAKGQTGTQANINSAIVRSTHMAVPPLDEQMRVTARLDAADASISTLADELSKLRLVKSGLMNDLLTGRVRVTDRHEGSA